MIKKLFILFSLSVACIYTTQAQRFIPVEYSPVNTSVGASAFVYLGDLTPNQFGDISKAKAGVQVTSIVPVNEYLGVGVSFAMGSLDGDDSRYDGWRPKRSFSFKSNVTEVSLRAQWAFRGQSWEWPEDDRYTNDYKIRRYKILSPYVFAGIGYLSNRVTREMDGIDSVYFYGDIAWERYPQEAAKVYKSGMAVAPVGIGTYVTLAPAVRFYAEYSYHFLFNDHLDGFGTAVVSPKPDAFHTITVGLDFRLLKYNTRRKKEICFLGL